MSPNPEKPRRRPEELSERHKSFLREYAICCDLELAQTRATPPYKPHHGNARRLINDPRARPFLKSLVKRADELAGIHLGWALANLKNIAGVNIHTLLLFDDKGTFKGVDIAKMTSEQAYAISEIGFDSEGRPKIKFHDKVAANRLIHDHLAPEKPARVRLEGPGGGPVEIVEGLGARLNAARNRFKERRSGAGAR